MKKWITFALVAAAAAAGFSYAAAQPPAPPDCAGPAQGRGHGPGPMRDLFVQADKNKDRQITFEELTAVKPDFPKDQFERMDQNNDGVLSPADRPPHDQRGPHGPRGEAAPGGRGPRGHALRPDVARIRAADKNDDRQVSPEEFRAAFPGAPEDAFKRRDRNGDGMLSSADLPKGGPEARPQGPPVERIRAADKDEDGKVTPEEWKAAFPHAPEQVFGRLDRNGDGALSPADAPKGAPPAALDQKTGKSRPEKLRHAASLVERLRKADTDNDGQVTPDEFKAAFPKAKEGRFEKLDRNDDGVLTEADRGKPAP